MNSNLIYKKGVIVKKITLLGSTGSIGTQAIEILKDYPNDFKIVALSGNSNMDLLLEQAKSLRPEYVVIFNEDLYFQYRQAFYDLNCKVLTGLEGLIKVATLDDIDVLLNAVVGNVGLMPTLEAIRAKKTIAIANKECLVTAGQILMAEAKKNNVAMIPIDSEHSAILQCLRGNRQKDIKRVILTASGGPFRNTDRKLIEEATYKEALKHPNWSMGQKISIDSATLMNKGLEVIEAKWLYDLEVDQIDVVVHRESIIHSLVEFVDHSTMAQLGQPTMKLPILYALTYPDRLETNLEPLDLVKYGNLSFESPRYQDFPCLSLAYESLRRGGLTPTVMNAANEVLVYAYLKEQIKFYDIPKYIERAMDTFDGNKLSSIDDILKMDAETRQYIHTLLRS